MTSLSEEHGLSVPRKLHSIAGVLPLLAFVVLHLWINARAMQGRASYDRLVAKLSGFPGLTVFEIVFLFAPLAFHAGYGLWVLARPARGARRSAFEPRWVPTLQRVSGAVTFVFLAAHLAMFRIPLAMGRLAPEDFHDTLTEVLSTTSSLGVPTYATAYFVGLCAVSYHLAVGLTAFCGTWGLVTTQRGYRIASACGTGLGAACFLVGARTIVYFAAGAPFP
jgi:succinate dehydrogenase/fumarate reductase cytochrome b subunit (b558 family)